MANILIVYYSFHHPMRATSRDYLYSWQRYSGHRCFYLNMIFLRIPWYIARVKWDLVIFTHFFTESRWNPDKFRNVVEKARPLKDIGAKKILFNQDEFIHTDVLSDFINEFGITRVYSCAKESEWGKIYSGIDVRNVRMTTVLPGYIEDSTVEKIQGLSRQVPERVVDIGYRASQAHPAWGRHGQCKVNIAESIQQAARGTPLSLNVSVKPGDTFLGDEWYRFLLQCKYTIGVEGGASLLDRDGSISARVTAYLKEHPGAPYREIEEACFPGLDGNLALFTVSPRHLEACITNTCQILMEGDYNGILQPGIHYIELKKDFSNINAVMDLVREDRLRQEMTDRAFRDVVAGGHYSYRNFVASVLGQALEGSGKRGPEDTRPTEVMYYHANTVVDFLEWRLLQGISIFSRNIFPHLPSGLRNMVKGVKGYIVKKLESAPGDG